MQKKSISKFFLILSSMPLQIRMYSKCKLTTYFWIRNREKYLKSTRAWHEVHFRFSGPDTLLQPVQLVWIWYSSHSAEQMQFWGSRLEELNLSPQKLKISSAMLKLRIMFWVFTGTELSLKWLRLRQKDLLSSSEVVCCQLSDGAVERK